MPRYTLALFPLLLLTIRAIGAEKDVVVLRSDERSMVFVYTPVYLPPHTVVGQITKFTLYDFQGAIPRFSEEQAGSPDLRFRSIPLAFPSHEGNAVQVLAADYEDIPNVMFAPVPTLGLENEIIEVKDYLADKERYAKNQFLPESIAQLSDVARNRSMILGNVQVNPLQYNPATRTLRKFSRLTIEVVYGTTTGVRVQNNDDEPFKNVLLNYDVARTWKFGPAGTLSKTSASPSVLASGSWYRLTVQDEGIYILNSQYLASAGINLAAVDPRTIKIYGNGGRELPEDLASARPSDLVENAIYVEGEGDGQFDSGDFILFYGKSPRGVQYDPAGKTLRHFINRYSEVNYYWLTFGGAVGKRMQVQASLSDPPTVVPDRFRDLAFVEEEKVNLVSSGKHWIGQSLNPGSSFTHILPLPGLIPNDNILYRYTLVARSEPIPSFTVREGGTVIGTHGLPTVIYDSPFTYAHSGTFQVLGNSSLPSATSQFNVTFNSSSVAASGWIDWVEAVYPRNFDPVNNYLRFRSPDTAGVVEYRLGAFTAVPMVFDASIHEDVRRIQTVSGAFRAQERAGRVSEYLAAASSAFRSPVGIVSVPNQNLRGINTHIDFIIVTSQEFRSAADRLKAHREQPAHGNLRTLVVDVNQIYNEFGGGLPDVTGIRDFLKFAYDNWDPPNPPRFLLMFGGASYDYKGIFGSKSNFVPTWQSLESNDGVFSYSTDDFFTKFGSNNAPWMRMGRLSPRVTREADALVDKIIRYETGSAQDSWKMRMLFVGDDGWTGERGDEGTLHSGQAETLAEAFTPNVFEKRKIYIAEYPTVNTAQGRRKPGAYQEIIDQINQGALIVNYTGHGNPTVWAHEQVFSVQTSIPLLTNHDKLSVFFGATCNFSQFDDPKRYTGSELLLNKADGGAIGVVSATRKVFAGENATLHQEIFRRLFSTDQFGRVVVQHPATAIYLFKTTLFNNVNDQKFFFMGDPSMRLQFPTGFASIESVNGQMLDSAGFPRRSPAQLKALSKVTVTGSVRNASNQIDSTANGTVSLIVNDATRRLVVVNFSPGINWTYTATGGTIFRGENSVSNGNFTASFIVPKDISYSDSTTRGRLVAYFRGDAVDGVGHTTNVWVGGTDENAQVDTTGPSMNLFLDSRAFRAGDLVREQPTLIVDLNDSSGINTSRSGIGHRIEAWINNSSQSIDLTEFYSSALNSFQSGTVEYQLKDLPRGANTVRVRAWDTYNNSRTSQTHFEVTLSDKLTISEIMNYPNPFAGGTEFTFKQNQLDPLNITIKIYTLAGRQVQVLEAFSTGEPFIRVPWDGRDRDGDIIANGVYLYKVIARTTDGRFSSEALGKLAVLR